MHARRTAGLVDDGVTRKTLRGPRFERRSHGLLRPAGMRATPEIERLDDAIGLLVPGTALGGWASLLHQGNDWFDGHRAGALRRVLVHCGPGTQLRRRDVVEPFRGLIRSSELTDVNGVPTSTLARAAFDEARVAKGLRAAVVVLDMATSSVGLAPSTTLSSVWSVVDSHVKVRGIVQTRKALSLASERSASPLETRTRLAATLDADLVGLRENVPVFGPDDELLGVVDLVDPATGLVIESDGAGHREATQHAKDNAREEALEHAGCVVVRVGAHDHEQPWDLAGRIRRAHRVARRPRQQSWTLDPPAWWWAWPGARRWLSPR